MQHVSVLASCGKVAMRFDAAGDRFVSVPNSAQTLCGNGANRNVAVCSQLPEATGKFAAGVYSAGVFNFGWFWACADVARSQNCTQVKGNFVDCWFSPVAMPDKQSVPACFFPSTDTIGLNFQSSLPRLPPNVAADYKTPCTRMSAPGLYCAGASMLVRCEDMAVLPVLFTLCPNGCKTNPPGTSDECFPFTSSDPAATPPATIASSAAGTPPAGSGSPSTATTATVSGGAPSTVSVSTSGSLVIVFASTSSAVGDEPSLVPVIVGAVIGTIAVGALIGLTVWYFKLRRSRYDKDLDDAAPAAVMMHRAPSTQAIPRRSLEKGTGEYTSAPPPTTSYAGGASGTTAVRPSRYETVPPVHDDERGYETAPPDTRYDHAQDEEERVMF